VLRVGFRTQKPLIAVDAAGCTPFFSKLPALDMLGLNDRHIARNPPKDFGKGKIGHELGDGTYVLSRKPDLVAFCSPGNRGRPCWRSGREMVGDPSFRKSYRLVNFEGTVPKRVNTSLWVRLDGRVGITRDAKRISIPGYLFATGATVAGLDGHRVVAELRRERPGTLEQLRLPAGSYRLRTQPRADFVVEVRGGQELAKGRGPLSFALSTDRDVKVVVRTKGTAVLEQVVIEPRGGER
jgi:hypothetical protein